VRMTVGYDRL